MIGQLPFLPVAVFVEKCNGLLCDEEFLCRLHILKCVVALMALVIHLADLVYFY
jgi:hypothetical protein